MKRALLPALLGLVALAAGACAKDESTCTGLRDKLRACGFTTPDQVDCARLDSSTEESLMQRLSERGCSGVAEGDSDAVDPRVCALAGWSCPGSPVPDPGAARPKNTVVLVSGIDGSPSFDWNPRVLSALRTAGVDAHHVQVLPWATTPDRASDLWASLQSLRGRNGGKVNLVCYAVGGIDCRYVASPNGLFKGDESGQADVRAAIASITTIATPHHGTRVADAALAALQSGAAADVLQALVGDQAPAGVPASAALVSTLDGLTLDALSAFNQTVTDAPGVVYQSWAGISHVLGRSSPSTDAQIAAHCTDAHGALQYMRHDGTNDAMNELLWLTSPFASASRSNEGRVVSSPADGMVSVESAKWGEFRGCLPADHYDVIGQISHTTRDGVTGFDAPRFYVWLASDLAARGL